MTRRLSRPIPIEYIARFESPPDQQAYETYLLHNDFSNSIIPYQSRRNAYWTSGNGIRNDLVETSLELDWWNRVESGSEGFIRIITSLLFSNHEVWIEIVPNSSEESEENDSLFRVFIVFGVQQDSSGKLIQKFPANWVRPDSYPEDEAWGQSIELDSSRMVHVLLPEEYSKRILRGILDELAVIVPALAPEWAFQQMTGQRPGAPRFGQNEASRIEKLRKLQVASPIGWVARENYSRQPWEITYYYYLLRELRFLHFVASMRECAEIALRQVLDISGKLCGFTASVTANGVYTPDDISGFIEEFQSGNLSFARVHEIIFQEAGDTSTPQSRTF